MNMREQEVKEIISVGILRNMHDQSAARVLRDILFDNKNKIDWDEAGNSIIEHMSELKIFKMELDDFIENIESVYQDAKERGFYSIVVAIDTDLDNTYYINDTEEGFQCDVFDYVFDDLHSVADQLYNELHGNVTEIRIE